MSKGRSVPSKAPTPRQEALAKDAERMVKQWQDDTVVALDKIWAMSRKELLSRLPRERPVEYHDEFLKWMISEFMQQKLSINNVRISDEETMTGSLNHLGYLFEQHGAWGLSPDAITEGLLEGCARYVKGVTNLIKFNALRETNLYEYYQEINTALRVQKIPRTPGERGIIYLIRCGRYYKIGKTRNLAQRIKAISTSQPHRVEVIHTIKTNNMARAEAFFHGAFDEGRKHREWFTLTAHQIKMM